MKYCKVLIGLSLLVCSTSLYADTIFVDGQQLPVESEIKRSMTYVPLRFIAEALGGTVEWQNPYATIKNGDMTIQFKVNSHEVVINGTQYAIPTVPYISNNYTYVPLRFISEQLGCDVSYGDDKIVRITKHNRPYTPPAVSEYVDQRNYSLSANQLWGVAQELIYTEHIVSIKNTETGETKDILSRTTPFSFSWIHNKLIIDNRIDLMLYDPVTDKFETLIKDFSGTYVSMPNINAVLYITGGYLDLPTAQYYIYPITSKKPEKITRERCHELLEIYAPEYITKGYTLSKDGLWGAMKDRTMGTVILKDMTNYTVKTIFTSDNTFSIKWLNNNLLINNSSVDHTMLLYNPKTNNLKPIIKGGFEEIFIEDLNALIYLTTTIHKDDSETLHFFIYYLETNQSKEITRDEFHHFQEKYLGHIGLYISEEANYAH